MEIPWKHTVNMYIGNRIGIPIFARQALGITKDTPLEMRIIKGKLVITPVQKQ